MNKKKKLKLTKLTISNLDRVKGGRPPCACEWTAGNGQFNLENYTFISCIVCQFTEDQC